MLRSRPGVGFHFSIKLFKNLRFCHEFWETYSPLKFLAAQLSSFLFLFRIVSVVSLLNNVVSALFPPHGFNEFSWCCGRNIGCQGRSWDLQNIDSCGLVNSVVLIHVSLGSLVKIKKLSTTLDWSGNIQEKNNFPHSRWHWMLTSTILIKLSVIHCDALLKCANRWTVVTACFGFCVVRFAQDGYSRMIHPAQECFFQ